MQLSKGVFLLNALQTKAGGRRLLKDREKRKGRGSHRSSEILQSVTDTRVFPMLLIGWERHRAIWQARAWKLELGDLAIYSLGGERFLLSPSSQRESGSQGREDPKCGKGGENSVRLSRLTRSLAAFRSEYRHLAQILTCALGFHEQRVSHQGVGAEHRWDRPHLLPFPRIARHHLQDVEQESGAGHRDRARRAPEQQLLPDEPQPEPHHLSDTLLFLLAAIRGCEVQRSDGGLAPSSSDRVRGPV